MVGVRGRRDVWMFGWLVDERRDVCEREREERCLDG